MQASGEAAESTSCLACHSLRIIHSQRLSVSAWQRELDKMERWGAVISDREGLLAYLIENFGEDRSPVPPQLTRDGSERRDGAKTGKSRMK
ncbi:MAG: hypothetical protein AB1898_29360 [Acidobacteriota bacterium]